jgi:1-phosphatidylinositol phosphodiesterase
LARLKNPQQKEIKMSVSFFVNFLNNTPFSLTLSATVASDNDWDSNPEYRPDHNIKGPVGRFSSSGSFFEKTHDYRSTAPFTVEARLEGHDPISFDLDGCNSADPSSDGEVQVTDGPASFSVFKVTSPNDNGNAMTIFLTHAVSTNNWMKRLIEKNGSLTLTDITIPGTHDTGTYNGNHEEGTQCQSMTIEAQLEAGIRFMDLRLKQYDAPYNDLGIFHQHYTQNLWLGKDVLPTIVDFLNDNPTECVIICVNHAVDGEPSYDSMLHDILMKAVPNNKLYDHNDATAFPLKLSSLQGCVVLMRRDQENTFGIDAKDWPDNPVYKEFLAGTTEVYLQDAYKTGWGDIQGKWKHVQAHLDLAALQTSGWFINFTSASYDGAPVLPWFPIGYATGRHTDQWGINSILSRYLASYISGSRLGTIMMDFPEYPGNNLLGRLLISMNERLLPL